MWLSKVSQVGNAWLCRSLEQSIVDGVFREIACSVMARVMSQDTLPTMPGSEKGPLASRYLGSGNSVENSTDHLLQSVYLYVLLIVWVHMHVHDTHVCSICCCVPSLLSPSATVGTSCLDCMVAAIHSDKAYQMLSRYAHHQTVDMVHVPYCSPYKTHFPPSKVGGKCQCVL